MTPTPNPTVPTTPPVPDGAVALTPMELNSFRLSGRHTRLTPEVLAAIAARQGNSGGKK